MRLVTARPHRLLPHLAWEIGGLCQNGESCMLLVPAQYTLQAEIELLDRLDVDGWFLIDVLSPGRLQSRVFERAGWPDRVVLDERGKRMIVGEAVEREKDALTLYRSAAASGAQGFADRVGALIADLKRSGCTAQALLLGAQTLPEESTARAKLLDAARLYAAYEDRTRGKLADAEDVSAAMRERLARSGVVSGRNVFVYGFDMITAQFAAELLDIAPLCASLTLAVETDDDGAPDGDLFRAVNASLSRLERMAAERGVPVEKARIRREIPLPEDLRALESGLFAPGARAFEGEPPHIRLRAASTQRAEVHLAASRMRRMLMEGEDGARMAVVYPKGSGYAPLLAHILPQYGIPAYIAEKRPASAHPLCRFVLGALDTVARGWRVQDLTECLQSGFLPLEREEADALCAYMEDFGVRPEAMRRPFAYLKGEDEAALDALNGARARAIAPLEALAAALGRASSADGVIEAVLALLGGVGAFDRLEAMRGELEAAGLLSESEDCAQVWNALMETLDQLHALLGDEDEKRGLAAAKLASSMLQDGLRALELSALPPADGAVICGEIGNVRTERVSALFALGMNDQSASEEEALLTPEEREEASRATGAYLGMTPSERAALARLDELKSLTGAQEMLFVSYALADETGRALREGMSVQAIRRLFPGLIAQGASPEEEQREMLAAPGPALEALSVRLSDAADAKAPLAPAFEGAYAALSAGARRDGLLGITRRLAAPPKRRLTPAKARALYGRPVMSVSRLETFAQCPYRHFVRYGLSPRGTREPGVDRAELGTLYHEAAERFTRAVTAMPEFPDIPPAVCDAVMDEAAAPLIEAWRQSPLGASARGASIARRIAKTARRAGRSILSQFAGGSFRPIDAEFVFGQNGVAPLTVELADGSQVFLQGRIDRVDAMDGNVIRVVDYKSGAKKFDPTMAYWGIQLQLLLYLAAALARLPGARAAGFFYCRIADPTVKTESRIREEVERQIAKKLALSGVSLSDVEILRAQGGAQAAMIAKDGRPSGRYRASLADAQEMAGMTAFAQRKAAQLAGDVYAGEIDDSPARFERFSACASCDYAAVCGFDPTVKPARRLDKKSAQDLR